MASEDDAINPKTADHKTAEHKAAASCLLIWPSPSMDGARHGSSLRTCSKGFAPVDSKKIMRLNGNVSSNARNQTQSCTFCMRARKSQHDRWPIGDIAR